MTNPPASPNTDFLFYEADDGKTKIQVRIQDETVWMSQKALAELFDIAVPTINHHIMNIFDEKELLPEATIRKYLIVQTEGRREVERLIDHYNLEMIIAVGYRVRSKRGTQFRQWATERLTEYMVKGFTMDDERLKDGRNLGQDYFDELLERIRDIRASERRFYQKITDIYAQCSIDYDKDSDISREFYATVQNKLHWAIHGHTAAELIAERAKADKPNMGLQTWKNSPHGKIRSRDVETAKNYLTETELKELNRIVVMYLDYAELQASRRQTMTMKEWADKLDSFLQFNEMDVLNNAGRISAEVAKKLALGEFAKYTEKQKKLEAETPTSDFDKLVSKTRKLEKGE
ncbi:MAG: virulence RhuM family protein [Geovibrio sp.]|nr:virulence RhuM family protein [Geovibrio sp.]